MDQTSTAIATHSQGTEPLPVSSAVRPNLRHHSPSPIKAPPASSPLLPPTSSVRASPCSSSFAVVTTSSPTHSAGMIAAPASSPAPPSISGRSSSIRTDVPSSPAPSPSLTSSSAFTRSLAASCISQSISQSMAKKGASWQQPSNINTVNQGSSSCPSTPSLPSSQLRQRSPSPKLLPTQQSPSTSAYGQVGYIKDGQQHPKYPPSSLLSSCPSPSLPQSLPPPLSHRSPSPSMSLAHHQPAHCASSRPSFLHSQQNANNNNNLSSGVSTGANSSSCGIKGAVSNGGWSGSPQKIPLANGCTRATVMQQSQDPLRSGSHNRVARPFSASEPNSRVQSPTLSPTRTSFSRLCSPPPQHKFSSPFANKPPNPRTTRAGGASSHNPLGLTLELPRASSTSSASMQSSSCLSPHILSPPPIGVSVNVWTHSVAAPQPRIPRVASSSPSSPYSTTLGSTPFASSSSASVSLHSSRASSPSGPCPTAAQTHHRSFSFNLSDRSPSPRSNAGGLRRSWAESSHSSLGFSGIVRGSFDKYESCPTSPRSGWSSNITSPSCFSPQGGLQSPLSSSRLTTGKGSLGGQHFTSVPWPDVRELSNKYKGADHINLSGSSTVIASSPSPFSSLSQPFLSSPGSSESQTDWGDPELEEGSCRSELICAYVAHPFQEQNLSSSCLALSSSGTTSTPTNYPFQVKPQPQVQINTRSLPVPPIHSPVPSNSSPLPFLHSSPTKPGNQKTSYATTVNLQIAGSGRITSFSTAQVSLTQTLQGGPGGGGPGPGQMVRRVSINGLSHIPAPLPQNCNRL